VLIFDGQSQCWSAQSINHIDVEVFDSVQNSFDSRIVTVLACRYETLIDVNLIWESTSINSFVEEIRLRLGRKGFYRYGIVVKHVLQFLFRKHFLFSSENHKTRLDFVLLFIYYNNFKNHQQMFGFNACKLFFEYLQIFKESKWKLKC
jgi:hypothetical protein